MKVEITYTEEALGTQIANREIHEEFIASKSADREKIKEELEALPAEDLIEKAVTVFPRMEDESPFWYDYQIRGYIKEFLQHKTEFGDFKIKVAKKEYKVSKWTYRRIVDNFIFVTPRKIKINIPKGSEMGLCTRPLRGETPRGPRVALATSETVPAGSTLEFTIHCLQPELMGLMEEFLNYGEFKGLSQWRNSGKGRFTWRAI